MSSEERTSQIEVGEQPAKPKMFKIKKKKLKIISEPRKDWWNYLRLNFRVYLKKHYSCIKIQANWKGYNLRKGFKKLNDNYTFTILNRCLDKYISDLDFNNKINLLMSQKKEEMKIFHLIYLKILLNLLYLLNMA